MNFNDVIGQDDIRQRLLAMAGEGRVPHALMFCGPQGCGKLALALAFAAYLLCPDHTDEGACGHCRQCLGLNKWQHLDLHFTFPVIRLPSMSSDYTPSSDDFICQWRELLDDSGGYFTMNDWMERMGGENQQAVITVAESEHLIQRLQLVSSQGGYKVALVWLPERMNAQCANKLLKLIEEPPSQTVFLMVAEEPELLLETIRSRVQRIDVKSLDTELTARELAARRSLSADDASRIARTARGSWTAALEALRADSEREAFFDMYRQLMQLAYQRKMPDLKRWTDAIAAYGREKQRRLLTYMLTMTRENFVHNFQDPRLNYMTWREEDFAVRFAPFVNELNVIAIYDLTNRALRDIGQNANAKIVFYDYALQMAALLRRKA